MDRFIILIITQSVSIEPVRSFGKIVFRLICVSIYRHQLNGIHKCRIVYGKEVEEVTYAPYQMRKVASLHLIESGIYESRLKLVAIYTHANQAEHYLSKRPHGFY